MRALPQKAVSRMVADDIADGMEEYEHWAWLYCDCDMCWGFGSLLLTPSQGEALQRMVDDESPPPQALVDLFRAGDQ